MERHNIIFLVWDASRTDTVLSSGERFRELANNNLSFEYAIAPSSWSLPSHVSLLNGEFPTTHGLCTKFTERNPDLSLITSLAADGYKTYGVSANSYASPRYGFDIPFDEFIYTMTRQSDNGININEVAMEANERGMNLIEKYKYILRKVATEKKMFANLQNIFWSGINKFDREFPIHPSLHTGYAYSAEWNTEKILDIINNHAQTAEPFFLFSNYMDTHFPYYPREWYSVFEELLNYRQLRELNDRVGHPTKFMESFESGNVSESDINQIRRLYEKETKTLDLHLGTILDRLDATGLLDQTIIVITADHGENLGEKDDRGYRRMGHHESVSDNHLSVPLVIAHPSFDARTVSEPSEVRQIATVLSRDYLDDKTIVDLLTSNENIIVEIPAQKDPELQRRYPNAPSDFMQRFLFEHTVVGFKGEWKVAIISDGSEWAWHSGKSAIVDEAPDDLLSTMNQHLRKLQKVEPLDELPNIDSLSQDTMDQLEDLGYM